MFGPCFVMHYLVSFLVLQSSRRGRVSCLFYLNCVLARIMLLASSLCFFLVIPVIMVFPGNKAQ